MEMTPLNTATGQCRVKMVLSGVSTSKPLCDCSSHITIEEYIITLVLC